MQGCGECAMRGMLAQLRKMRRYSAKPKDVGVVLLDEVHNGPLKICRHMQADRGDRATRCDLINKHTNGNVCGSRVKALLQSFATTGSCIRGTDRGWGFGARSVSCRFHTLHNLVLFRDKGQGWADHQIRQSTPRPKTQRPVSTDDWRGGNRPGNPKRNSRAKALWRRRENTSYISKLARSPTTDVTKVQ